MIPSTLDPHGPGAGAIAQLWWLLLIMCTIVAVLALAALAYAALRRREDWRPPTPEQDRGPTRAIVYSGIVAPALILTALFIFVLVTLAALARPGDSDFAIVVTGHRWWWDVQYDFGTPALAVRTANELHIPVGERVRIELKSADVIHSFWVPQLQGKMDLVPGRTNWIWIQADEPGVFRGQCAEFCGRQHAHMALHVIAHEPAAFERWLNEQRAPAASPVSEAARRGQQVYLQHACVLCHAIRGTNSRATVAPDLTHVASRRYLAAGTVPNTFGHLAGWITDPQRVKPGALMPRVPLQPDELHQLTHYLMNLR